MDRPVVTEHPMDKTVPAPETATFTCAGQGYGNVTVEWTRGRGIPDKAIITNTPTSDGITSTLTIPNITGSDGGGRRSRYRCRFTNSAGSTDSERATLTVGGEIIVQVKQCYVYP